MSECDREASIMEALAYKELLRHSIYICVCVYTYIYTHTHTHKYSKQSLSLFLSVSPANLL